MDAQRAQAREVEQQLPVSLRSLICMERFAMHRIEFFQDPSQDAAFDSSYLPQNCGVFALPCYWVERRHVQLYGQQTSANEFSFVEGGQFCDRLLFPVHPTCLEHYQPFLASVRAESAAHDGLTVWAIATSSTRTVLAWPDHRSGDAAFVKLSLTSQVFGDRRLRDKQVASSVGFSSVMQRHHPDLAHLLGYFPESLGFVPRRLPLGGAIVRSIPAELKADETFVAPLFALLSCRDGDPPLLALMAERSRLSITEFVEDVLCARFARLWVTLTARYGLLLEAHAQNLLLATSPTLAAAPRFYYRDFEGLQVDWELRHRCKLAQPEDMPRAARWHDTYATWDSSCSDMVSMKWRTSLSQYLHLVLNELDGSLRKWRAAGLIRWQGSDEETTMTFSRHVLRIVSEISGVPPQRDYNIYSNPNRFVTALLKLRARWMPGPAA